MVDLGPRLTGAAPHEAFCTWVERELAAAGLEFLAPDEYAYDRWLAERVALEVTDGDRRVPVQVASAFVRSASTPREGVTGPLVHLGPMPMSASGGLGSPGALSDEALDSWLGERGRHALAGAIVVVVELRVPTRLTARGYVAMADYPHWPGHGAEDWAAIDYTRPWVGPWPDLATFAQLGVAGPVLVADAPQTCSRGTTRRTSAGTKQCRRWWWAGRRARSSERCVRRTRPPD